MCKCDAINTIRQLLIGDSWSSVLYEGVRVSGEAYNQIFAASFIILWFCFSKLIVSNIFVAVIIENFRVTDTIEAVRLRSFSHVLLGAVKCFCNCFPELMHYDDISCVSSVSNCIHFQICSVSSHKSR